MKVSLWAFERWACERKDSSKSENKMHRKKDFCLKHRYNLPKWLLILFWLWYVWRDLQRVQTIWHSSLIMEFWMNNVLRMQGNNGCEVLHLFLQQLGLLPLTCSVFLKKNLANTGHTQLSGAASVSLLKIPLIIFPPPCSTFGWRECFALFSQTSVLTLLLVLVVFDVIWQHLF